jgi:hypothetical protein
MTLIKLTIASLIISLSSISFAASNSSSYDCPHMNKDGKYAQTAAPKNNHFQVAQNTEPVKLAAPSSGQQ